ncbi:RNA polymerase sigma factor [Streptomyces olivaceoviridis]|uniref:RNA polymerase sigma factor n=1 Tax=Streptomyces olivaceoviridis TaxID=1921 RepID=UPI001675013E|nr:RNA polymerase sigma factor [Streptomyces olivaceoviridis]
MNGYQSMPDCLGCCEESVRRAVVFPAGTESPTGLYAEADRWCSRCWVHRAEFERFHLLYSQRLTHYVFRRLRYLPYDRRRVAAEDVVGETVELLWRDRRKHRVPERVMYAIACRLAARRSPLEKEPLALEEPPEETTDPMEDVEDLLTLEEEFAKLPEKTRRYLYEHKGLGKTAQEVASGAGVSKGAVTVSVSRGLRGLREAFGIIRMVLDLIRHILPVLMVFSESPRIWEWWS